MHSAVLEQTKYWMWSRRRFLNSFTPNIASGSSYESWEEQAFAEDSAGRLGGCIWPPRSYTCSFCRREFRSAQALGGHMNVHRRDRARLKQSPSPTSENRNNSHHLHHLNPCSSLGDQYPHQVCTPIYNPNPNPDIIASPLSPSRASAASTQENCSDHTLVSPSYSSSIIQEHRKISLFSTPRSLADSIPIGLLTIPKLKHGRENSRQKEVNFRAQKEYSSSEDEEEAFSRKRRRINPLLELGPSHVEELDLELRLGDRPKVK